MMNFYNYDVTKYGRCTTDDLLFEVLYDYYFEMIFWKYFHFKKDCADRHFEITYFSISGQHNLWKQFLMLLGLRWLMTIICKWAGQNFRTQNYFGQKNTRYFIDENTTIITIFVHKKSPAEAGQELQAYRIISISHTTRNTFQRKALHFNRC